MAITIKNSNGGGVSLTGGTSGSITTVDASQPIYRSGSVVQEVFHMTDEVKSWADSTYIDLGSNFHGTITPVYADSKIKVEINMSYVALTSNSSALFALYNHTLGTFINRPNFNSNSSGIEDYEISQRYADGGYFIGTQSIHSFFTAGTTNAVTVALYGKMESGTAYINTNWTGSTMNHRGIYSITLKEIKV